MGLRSNPRTLTLVRDEADFGAAVELNLGTSKVDQAYVSATVANSRRTGKRLWDWYECVDHETEILTIDKGWVTHNNLVEGDQVYAFDMVTGTARWETVSSIYRRDVIDEPMVGIEMRHHSSLTTGLHRWPVRRVAYGRTGQPQRLGRYVTETYSSELLAEDQLITAAPSSDRPLEAKYDDDLVELVAWAWTEGHIRSDRRSESLFIYQSSNANPDHVARIRRCLNRYAPGGFNETESRPGEHMFSVHVAPSAPILAACPNRVVQRWFLDQLTLSQLQLFIDVSIMADGIKRTGHLSQNSRERSEAFAFALILAGRTPHMTSPASGMHHVFNLGRSTVTPYRKHRSEQTYTGTIWCPTTPSTTWMARRRGTVYFTGNCIAEVHYGIARSARIAGYGKLSAVTVGPDGQPESEIDSGLPAQIVQGITSPFGGTRQLLDRFYTLMKVPGDSYLCEMLDDEGDPEGYHFMSPDELDVSSFSRWSFREGQLRWITVPAVPASGGDPASKAFVRTLNPDQMLGRVWAPSKRYVDLTDSALAALDTECETLYLLTKSIKAKLMSRFATAGILFLPNGISTARITRDQEQVAGQKINNTLNYLIAAMTRNMKNWDNAATWLPIMLQGNGDDGEKIKHLVLDRDVFENDLQLRGEAISRILQGLDSNQDQTQGTAGRSHFQLFSASDEERRIAVQPDIEMLQWAMTRLILHRKLMDAGWSPDRILKTGINIDLSKAAVRSNQQEDARQLGDRGKISNATILRLNGMDESDAPSEDEYVRWLGEKMKNPILATHGMAVADDIDWDEVAKFPGKTGPEPASQADKPEAGPGVGNPGQPGNEED